MKVEDLKLLDEDLIYVSQAKLKKSIAYSRGCISIPVRDIYSRNTQRYIFSLRKFAEAFILTPTLPQRILILIFGKKMFEHVECGKVKLYKNKLYKVRNSKRTEIWAIIT